MKKTRVPALRFRPGARIRLRKIDAGDPCGFDQEDRHGKRLERTHARLAELQGRLYAENRRALLVVLQGMDTAGKDGTIRHVFSFVNPQGCEVQSFVAPSAEERDHDFLWRVHQRVPRYGNIGIFNRSHYEDVLAVRVRALAPRKVWKARYEQINRFEQHLVETGTRIVKIFLHIDRDEQRERLLARLRDPRKAWKYDASDLEDRKLWKHYEAAYDDALTLCNTAWAPWSIVPANRKWARNLIVAETILAELEAMAPKPPPPRVDGRSVRIPR